MEISSLIRLRFCGSDQKMLINFDRIYELLLVLHCFILPLLNECCSVYSGSSFKHFKKKTHKKTNLAIHLHTNSAFTVQTQSTKKKMYVLFYFYKAFFAAQFFLNGEMSKLGILCKMVIELQRAKACPAQAFFS